MVNVLLPCVVVGTTIGVICNLVTPELASDILIILLFTLITYLFIKKYTDYKLQKKISSGELSRQLLTDSPERKRPSSASSKVSVGSGVELVKIV